MPQRLIIDGQTEKQKDYKKNKPLLITGSHRSGSTWIGKVIEQSDKFLYLNEPTSPNTIPGSVESIEYWFQYIKNDDTQIIEDLSTLNKNALNKNRRALFKDPLAFFSINTFIEKLDTDVLISVRHPAAFVSSLKRLGWSHDFNHFLEQKELMETYLYPFENEIQEFAKNEKDIIDQGILLWNIINHNTLKFKQKYPKVYIVRHEDLSFYPIKEFKKIFEYFNIPFTPKVKKFLVQTTNKNNSSEVQDNVVHQLHRDSKANIYNFKDRLTEEEIKRIQMGTKAISHIFYDQGWWENNAK
ncbi:MAG: sulfotransferase domain-containing protein [Bacteroidales bacterium]|nr:sulfotransferase domain-containing protein [Bacteroidales bacterium]